MADRDEVERLADILDGNMLVCSDAMNSCRNMATHLATAHTLRALSARLAEVTALKDALVGDKILLRSQLAEAEARAAAAYEEAAKEVAEWGRLMSGHEDVSAEIVADIYALATDAERDALAERDARIRKGERERCAKIADGWRQATEFAEGIAAAIRGDDT